MTPSPNSEPSSTGPPDREILRLLESILADEPVVASTEFDPDNYEPRILRVLCEESRYPSAIKVARLDIRWFGSGDFSIHYVETTAEDHWECRWDHHPNPHNARLHFHRPPTGEEVADLRWTSLHPIDVVSTVVAAVEQRIEHHWSADDL